MRPLRQLLDRTAGPFKPGGKLEILGPLFEAIDSLLYTTGKVTAGAPHVRDALNLKRVMIIVVLALMPPYFMGMYNTGLQIHLAVAAGAAPLDSWQTALFLWLGFGLDPGSIIDNVVHGAAYVLPIYVVTMAAGGFCEVLFAVVRKHEVAEGFFVTGALIPLLMPATIPLWQVAMATMFAVVIAKEIFGGVGMNILNPALTARAFLFFAYPGDISGELVWVAVDKVSGATPLAAAAYGTNLGEVLGGSWWDAFLGFIPGSLGETSALACLIGAVILVATGIGSWRTMLGVTVGTFFTVALFNAIGSDTNQMFAVSFGWHVVLGGWALGTVFMATDPVSSPFTNRGKLIYGFLIGLLVVLIRVVNPAYQEGMMLAILFMNVFAPLIDHMIVKGNIKRRAARHATT